MNFLAHFYLSQSDEKILVGNFLGDFVKGKAHEKYETQYQQGILFHRHIDHQMDSSDMHESVKELVRPHCGKFTGVALDLLYDHLLAISWKEHSSMELKQFEDWVHKVLNAQREMMDSKPIFTLDAMIRGRWLSRYATVEGFERSCVGLASRINASSGLEQLPALLIDHKSTFMSAFERFFPVMVWSCFNKYASFART